MKLFPFSHFRILASRYLPTILIKYMVDLGVILSSCWLAKYILHIDIEENFYMDVAFLVSSMTVVAYLGGLYHHLWRFTSLYDVLKIFNSCLALTLLYGGWLFYTGIKGEELFKLSFLFIIFSFVFLNFNRVMFRLLFEEVKLVHQKKGQNIILIGAGKGGELFIREARKRFSQLYHIEGILDDDPTLWGKKLFGVKVYGPIKDISKLASSYTIHMVVIAIPSLEEEKLIEITQISKDLGLPVKVLPSFDNLLIDNHMATDDISIDDLLGRDIVKLDTQEVSHLIKGKTVLITGAGGSIGAEICRQIIKLEPLRLIMVDHSEYNLYAVSWELEHSFKNLSFIPLLASVTDPNTMENIFKTYQPEIVFHAAAYKHVPLLENQVKQAVNNNFFGTKTVAELASTYKAEKFILISTDKAVNPTNVMGTTKRMAEIFCQNFNNHSSTNYIIVRFGNVLGSAGSVIPLFKKQLKQGGPLTVTHPEITRFFMSIPEASQLVLQAGAMGKGGEIFVLDMGSPIKICHLAERLIKLSGKRPYKDVDIIFTGLRPGEKLYEELFYGNEQHINTKRNKIFLTTGKADNFEDFEKQISTLERSLEESQESQLIEIIQKMVPEAKINYCVKDRDEIETEG